MDVTFRQMDAADRALWAHLRAELWPDESVETHRGELDDFLQRSNFWGFVAELPDGTAAGFVEVAIRDYANGCICRAVAFLEGIWVREELRRQQIGTRLLEGVTSFLLSRGFTELGSDALIDNGESHAAHSSWGFEETERVIYFRKDLRQVGP